MTTILREARIIMPPRVGMEGARDAIDRMEQRIVTLAGGFTCTPSVGGWYSQDLDTVIEEDVLVYDVAISEGQNAALLEIALAAGRELDQHSIYFRNSAGVVSIIEVGKAEEELSRGGRIPEEKKPAKRPHDADVGDIWETRDGSLIAFTAPHGSFAGYLFGSLLKQGNAIAMGIGKTLSYDRKGNGSFDRDFGEAHPLDLVRLHSTF